MVEFLLGRKGGGTSILRRFKASFFLRSGPNRGRSPVEWGDFPYVRSSVLPSVLRLGWLAGPQIWLDGPQARLAGPQIWLDGPQARLAGPQARLAGPQIWLSVTIYIRTV